MAISAKPARHEPICGMDSWMPVPARIVDVKAENFNTRTFRMQLVDEDLRTVFRFAPGQFNMVYVPGVGEAAISISPRTHSRVIRWNTRSGLWAP